MERLGSLASVLVPLAMSAVSGMWGCGVEVLDSGEGGQVPIAVEAAFARSCASLGCHGSSEPAAGLSLEGAGLQNLVDRFSSQRPELPLIAIGDVPGSYLAIKVLSDEALANYGVSRAAGTSRMPFSGLTDEALVDVALILGWIAGAELPVPSGDGDLPTGESFQEDIFPILLVGCGCHQQSGGAGGLEYNASTAYGALVDQPTSIAGLVYVVPSDPDASYLLSKIDGTYLAVGGDGVAMPPTPLGPLAADEIELIRTWIDLGANP